MDADVVVVGAGPGGSLTGYLLAQRGWRVLLLDKAEFPRDKTCGDGLTPWAVATLEDVALASEVLAGAQAIYGARLWVSGLDLEAPFRGLVDPLPPRGYVLPRRQLDGRLLEAARRAGVRFWGGCQAVSVAQRNGVMEVQLRGGPTDGVCGRAVVIATGAAIGLLHRMGALRQAPHDIRAARAYWEGVEGLSPNFEFFFLPELPWGYAWIFPLGRGRANVGVGMFGPGTRVGSPAAWAERLFREHPALAHRFRGARRVGPVQAYPLRSDFPRHRVWGPGWLAVGEAAGLVNPVTGEGIDLALWSAVQAAQVLDRALRRCPGVPRRLRAYRWRLVRRWGAVLSGLRWLRRIVMRPRALRIIVARAQQHPRLLQRVVRLTLGLAPPWEAFYPSTWWWLWRGRAD